MTVLSLTVDLERNRFFARFSNGVRRLNNEGIVPTAHKTVPDLNRLEKFTGMIHSPSGFSGYVLPLRVPTTPTVNERNLCGK